MAAASRRLFFTLWPTDQVRQQISAVCAEAVQAAAGKPVPPANYHITLAFLGSVPVEQIDALVAAARSVQFEPFSLRLDTTGYWPRPRVAWLKPDTCPPPLAGLVADLWAVLAPLGFGADARSYKPHVSLVRKAPAGLSAALEEAVVWPVDGFALACSETLPTGPVYTLLEHFPAAAGML